MKTYTTVQGDMWDMIAYRMLGSVELTDRLMWANQRYLEFYTFPAGIVLDIPEIKAGSAIEGLPPWKQSGEKRSASAQVQAAAESQSQTDSAPTRQEITAMVRAAVAGAMASLPKVQPISDEDIDKITEVLTDGISG